MINGEYGNTLRISAEEDISANTNTIELVAPGTYLVRRILTTVDGVTVGTTDKTEGGIPFVTDEYVEYEFAEGDISIAGVWSACLVSLTPGGQNKILGPLDFTVDAC